nr:MAG TPA: hypothetical protein [Caudoviricetes sp.]
MALDTRQSPRFSMSWMVRREMPDSSTSFGTERPLPVRMLLRFMVFTPFCLFVRLKSEQIPQK